MIKELEAIDPGKLFKRVQLLESSPLPNEIYTNQKIEEIKQGIEAKNKKKKVFLSEAELDGKIQLILDSANTKYQQKLEEIEKKRSQLVHDKKYQKYKKIRDLWSLCGCVEMAEEYKQLDQQIGLDRTSRGDSFEEKADLIFYMIAARLPHTLCATYTKMYYVQSALWLFEGKPVGELDLVILGELSTGEAEVVALVEMKSNFYCLAPAWCRQHTVKMSNRESHCIQLPDKTVLTLHSVPEFYVATLIPTHEYLIGAEKDILDSLKEPLDDLSILQDETALHTLMVTLKKKFDLTHSPEDVLRDHPDKILVLT